MTKKKDNKINKLDRPLSPHLTIYKPQITSVLSITHRITGVFLSLGALAISWWIISLGHSLDAYQCVIDFFRSWFGKLLLLGWTFSIFYHLANGVRHLAWDVGAGFELKTVTASGIAVIIFSAALTVLVWVIALELI